MTLRSARAADEEFRIQWLRPRKIGEQERVRETIDGTIESVVKRPSGEQRKTLKRHIEFAGSLTIMEVDDQAGPSKVKVTIDKATLRLEPGGQTELAKTGTVVTADIKAGKAQLVLDQAVKLAPDGQEVIASAIAYPFDAAANLEETLGVVEPQKVGATWPVSVATIIKRIGPEFDAKLEPPEVKGSAKFTKVSRTGDKDFVEVEYQYKAESDRPFTLPGASSEITPGPSVQETTGNAQAPADRSTGLTASRVKIKTERKFKTKADEKDKNKAPVDNLYRRTDQVELRIEYVGAGGPKKPGER